MAVGEDEEEYSIVVS